MSDIKLACDVVEQVRAICDKHGNQPGELINILHEAQHLHGDAAPDCCKAECSGVACVWRGNILYFLYDDS